MTAPAMPMPTPIETPADFPVTWESPIDQMLLWEREQLHFPYPMPPLVSDLVAEVMRDAGERMRAFGAPIAEFKARAVNSYIYVAVLPDFALIDGAEERMKQAVMERGFTMYQRWTDEYLPIIEGMSRRFIEGDFAAVSDDDIPALWDEVMETFFRAWGIHFDLMPGFYTAPAFKDACREMFGYTGLEAYEMLQGRQNLSVVSGSELWRLAKEVSPALKAVITEGTSAEALAALETNPEGRDFLVRFRVFLDSFGWRTGSFDMRVPSWQERPDLALDSLRLMFRVTTDPAEDQRRGFERGEVLAGQCRAKLAGDPAALGQFEFMLDRARDYPSLQENHNFYLDQKFFATLRRPLVEIGRRMVAWGVIDSEEDVSLLHRSEVESVMAGNRDSMAAVVVDRTADLERWAKFSPPVAIGSMPPVEDSDPFMKDFFGRSQIEPAPERSLKGTPSSRGRATGTARVIRDLAEADRVQEGDVLVCEMTTPAWTPLFASLAAIVSDSGGPLSHCAVVAREYGVPCVTGTRIATRTIPDGAMLEVDGETGMVRILD